MNYAYQALQLFSTPLFQCHWGLVGGSALLLGVALDYFVKIPQRAIAAIMAFGAGVLIKGSIV